MFSEERLLSNTANGDSSNLHYKGYIKPIGSYNCDTNYNQNITFI